MHKIKAVCAVLGFALIATLLLPLVVFDFTAANEDFPVVTVNDSGRVHTHETAAQTVGELLSHVGISLAELDRVSYPTEAPIYDGMEIGINRAVRFYVMTDNNPPTEWTMRHGTTIFEVLSIAQGRYSEAFLYGYDMTRAVTPQDILRFSSWRSRYYTEIVELPYEIYRNYTSSVRIGRTYVRQRGVVGEHEVTINVVYIGGYEDSRTETDTVMLSYPVTAIYDIGTSRLGELANPHAEDFHYIRRVRMQATAYCACFLCTGRNPTDRNFGVTASGRRVEHGIVAVDRNVIALGTNLYVENYGFALAADVGGAIIGNRIDLFMYNHQDALRFGRRYVYVWVLG
ncbi:MAG: 3D domain-containing protein [Defluviitaleaceae bacterium]|nr:3D domain-containing protein [Defluviitaleaceae bacterium]MCL2274138.1 3D domain-containing protein [Defluviitaleaceae bacterium]